MYTFEYRVQFSLEREYISTVMFFSAETSRLAHRAKTPTERSNGRDMKTVVEGTIKHWPVSVMAEELESGSGVSIYCSPEEIHEGKATPQKVVDLCLKSDGEYFSMSLAMKRLKENGFRRTID
ncbi:hypothetical protein A3843_00915 [Pseudovibrio exalbescens]|uniref:Uncharacterized protein n=2 Tax=Pseudovibrio exalbescens TaxID=197461 RepID=A0A1U7JCB7_9HYPH|nr:hypothetical protein A3843_00915 [Pseudovibrio exalbescens]